MRPGVFRDGELWDYDCTLRWAVDIVPDQPTHLVDGGLVVSDDDSFGEVGFAFYGAPA